MGNFQIKVQPKIYDAAIVGSGVVDRLASAGHGVTSVEAGIAYVHRKKVPGSNGLTRRRQRTTVLHSGPRECCKKQERFEATDLYKSYIKFVF
jgi:choline dehydrogenase-like flavoprotein